MADNTTTTTADAVTTTLPVRSKLPEQAPSFTLELYSRLLGRKHLFTASKDTPASYFLTNPVPHRHAGQWRPIFYRGENPKYTPDTTALARARRSAMWSSFKLWIGDGVHEILANEKRAKNRRRAERSAKWRKRFGMKPKPPKEPLEDEKEVVGRVVLLHFNRAGFWNRKMEFEVEGVRYRWSGTRMFGRKGLSGWKGFTHDLKVCFLFFITRNEGF